MTEKLWPTVLDHILVGHVMEVVDASSLIECMTSCLQAEQEFSFVCRSAMWYPNDEDQVCSLYTTTSSLLNNQRYHPGLKIGIMLAELLVKYGKSRNTSERICC